MKCPICAFTNPHCRLCETLAASSHEDAMELSIALQTEALAHYRDGTDCAAMSEYAAHFARMRRKLD